jgi:hypothetical protein
MELELEMSHYGRSMEMGGSTELELSHHGRSMDMGRSTELELSHHVNLGRSTELGIVSSSLNNPMDLPY